MIHTEMGTTKITVTEKEMKVREAIASIINEVATADLLKKHENISDKATCYSDLCSIYLAMIDKFGERTATKLTVKAMNECYHKYISISPYPKENKSHDL